MRADTKPGEWNRFFITLNGKSASVELNGKEVSKGFDLTEFPERGPVEFENSGEGIEFRNVFVKELN